MKKLTVLLPAADGEVVDSRSSPLPTRRLVVEAMMPVARRWDSRPR